MAILSEVLAYIGSLATQIIATLGYPGVFFMMVLESMIFPVPSELVMPFAGFLIAQGNFSFLGVIIASSLGSIVGSLISYYIGRYGGNAVVYKLGKYLLLHEADLVKTEEWFAKKGEWTIFVGRLIPVVRHLISIPAGVGKMPLGKFCTYTIIGATIWNTFLAYLGYLFGENWAIVRQYSEPVSITAAILIVIGAVWFVYHHVKTRRTNFQ